MKSPVLWSYLFVTRRFKSLGAYILGRRLRAEKEHPERFDERQGIASAPRPVGELIWFHAASPGEALSIVELMRQLSLEDDGLNFLLTTASINQVESIEDRLPENAIQQFAPLDFRHFVDAFLAHWQPDLAVWTESEVWPNLLFATAQRKIPLLLLNARMSEQSYRRWRPLRGASRELLALFSVVHAQDVKSAERFIKLGAKSDLVEVTGPFRESFSALPYIEAEREELIEVIGRRGTWLAAMIHDGEEEAVARAHREILKRAPRTLLIVVPDDPEGGGRVEERFRAFGWRTALRSLDQPLQPDTEIYIADTEGELGLWYRIAPVSFVGGTLCDHGGRNPLEPAALGSAILHGPCTENYQDSFDRLLEAGASRSVRGAEELAGEVIKLLAPDEVAAMAHAAWELCSRGADVTDRAVEAIFDNLGKAQ